MFSPPSPKRNPYKSVLNRYDERRYAKGKRRQEQQHRVRPDVRSQEADRVKYDPKEHTLKRRAQRATQALKEYQNEKSPRRNRLRQQRDDAMEESNKVRKENAKLRMMLKENYELKRKYEELQKIVYFVLFPLHACFF